MQHQSLSEHKNKKVKIVQRYILRVNISITFFFKRNKHIHKVSNIYILAINRYSSLFYMEFYQE